MLDARYLMLKCWDEGLAKSLICALFVFNLGWILYPDQLMGAGIIEAISHAAVRYINPVILTFSVAILFNKNKIINNKFYFLASVLASMAMVFSSLLSRSLKSFLIAAFFIVAALAIMFVKGVDWRGYQHLFKTTLVLWITVPVVLLLNCAWWGLFISYPENSFHGFADNRVLYGLWGAAVALIYFSNSCENEFRGLKYGFFYNVLYFLIFLGIYLSQSRGSVVSIAVSCIYYIFGLRVSIGRRLVLSLGVLFLVAGIFFSWKFFGRQEPFEFVNSTRQTIAEKYVHQIQLNFPIFGAGGQVDVVVDGHPVQAHNFLIQWVANWGWVGLVSFLIYGVALWRLCEALSGKMLLIALFVFSLTQPIQGTANFFGPVTLCFLLFVAMTESVHGFK